MHIRPLLRTDIPEVLPICYQVFSRDELFVWLYPNLDQYPDDLRRSQLIRLRTRLVDRGSHGFVTETEPGDPEWTGTPEITGFAFYVREGDDKEAGKWRKDPLMNKIERHLLSWDKWYEQTFHDRVTDRANLALRNSCTDFHFYSQLTCYWHLGLLGVSQKHQRRGIGGKLVAHLQEIAQKEKVPVTLESSVMGRGLYRKRGFRIIESSRIVEDLGGLAMLWEPEGMEGVWLEVDEEGQQGKMRLKAAT